MPAGAKQAVTPKPEADAVVGTVWRDFKPGGGKPGVVEPGELGLPGVTVELLDAAGKQVDTATTEPDGSFRFADLAAGGTLPRGDLARHVRASPTAACRGSSPRLITPAIMIAYIWVWAGFAMVVIAAGLAAIPRDVLEAARTDGASEWQVFRRVTVPLLAPVLSVVFITMMINVLKVFDIVLVVAPGLGAGRRQRDRARDVALVVRRRQRLRPRLARSRSSCSCSCSRSWRSTSAASEERSTRWPPSPKSCPPPVGATREPVARRILRFLGGAGATSS